MSAASIESVVIVGGGQAAVQAVDSLRREGYAGALTLVADEPVLPYQRPPLSKKFLAGELDVERLWLRPASYYEQQRCELRLGRRAVAIDRGARRVRLDDGATLGYDRLILATGSRPRPVTVAGAGLPGVHYLRTVADVDGLRSAIRPGLGVVIVGAGYIGLETAATCLKLGLAVTVLEMADRVLNRVVAPEMSAFFTDEHARHGVTLHTNALVTEIVGNDRVEAVLLSDGRRIGADLVIVGIGILPNVELAQHSDLAVANGIAVDEQCRTSDPDIYAIGDCANAPNLRYHRRARLESVDNAVEQGKLAAASICGKPTSLVHTPWFWSDQYDVKLQIVGLSQDYDQIVIRGDRNARSFTCCYLREHELIAVDAVNNPKDFLAARKAIAEGLRVDPLKLADPSIPLRETV